MIYQSAAHHAQKVIELIIMVAIAKGMVVDGDFEIGADQDTGVLRSSSVLILIQRCSMVYRYWPQAHGTWSPTSANVGVARQRSGPKLARLCIAALPRSLQVPTFGKDP